MTGSMLILFAAMIAQPPTADRSAPQDSGAQAKRWLDTVDPVSNRPIKILGWAGPDGSVRFDPRDYPQWSRAEPQRPAPVTGVVREKIPAAPVAGQVWQGGGGVQATGDAAGDDKPPAAYVTIIGPSEWERSVAQNHIEQSPKFRDLQAKLGDRLAVHDYAPTDVMIANVGMPDEDRLDVVVQDASGKETDRFHCDPGGEPVADAVRRIVPGYHPLRDAAAGLEGDAMKAAASFGVMFVLILMVGLAIILIVKRLRQ